MQSCSQNVTNNKPAPSFLQAGCPSCRPNQQCRSTVERGCIDLVKFMATVGLLQFISLAGNADRQNCRHPSQDHCPQEDDDQRRRPTGGKRRRTEKLCRRRSGLDARHRQSREAMANTHDNLTKQRPGEYLYVYDYLYQGLVCFVGV